MKTIKDLSPADKLELKELYDGTFMTIRELSKIFDISTASLRYFFDYKNYREKQKLNTVEWQKNNPEQYKKLSNKAVKKWQKNNPEKFRNQQKIRYQKYKEEILRKQKIRYQKNKLKNL